MQIAFGYKMGTGKDACVKYLINNYGGEKIYFAKPIYDILQIKKGTLYFDDVYDSNNINILEIS